MIAFSGGAILESNTDFCAAVAPGAPPCREQANDLAFAADRVRR
jgi:hypothetical protein